MPAQVRLPLAQPAYSMDPTKKSYHYKLRGYKHLLDEKTNFRIPRFPHALLRPALRYLKYPDDELPYRHFDVFGRLKETSVYEDRYISPYDGKIKKLTVQATDEIWDKHEKTSETGAVTWQRTFIRNQAPLFLRLALWPTSHIGADRGMNPWWSGALLCIKWILAVVLLIILIAFQVPSSNASIRNNGNYDAFPYIYDGVPKVTRNHLENKRFASQAGVNTKRRAALEEQTLQVLKSPRAQRLTNNTQSASEKMLSLLDKQSDPSDKEAHQESKNLRIQRLIKDIESANKAEMPTKLCMLREESGFDVVNTEEYLTKYPETQLQYAFISWTSEQFYDEDQIKALTKTAEQAARGVGDVHAFWISSSCLEAPVEHSRTPEQERYVQDEVYKMADIIRRAYCTVVIIGRDRRGLNEIADERAMLNQLGSRLWILPELLLARDGIEIWFCNVTENTSKLYDTLLKNGLASHLWGRNLASSTTPQDSTVVGQLISHYEGTLDLSSLELATLALKCFHASTTTEFFKGDHTYALMGLFRTRPAIDSTDSQVQAFARLSLLNDSDQLLERLICVLPRNPAQEWHVMDDAYGASLWDFYPHTQISGIGEDDTIIVDGFRAANIRWKSFWPVYVNKIDSWKRFGSRWALHGSGGAFVIAIGLLTVSGYEAGATKYTLRAVGLLMLIWAIFWLGLAPWLIKIIYSGKFWGQQSWLFGFEGYVDLQTIEHRVFGTQAKLRWSCFGSPLSEFTIDEYGNYRGLDPYVHNEQTRKKVDDALCAKQTDMRIFTLVDTTTMEVILFEAARPPVALLLAGYEGGMQRAIGVSYDWTNGTLYRETVLRMPTPLLEKMDRIPRARFGLNPKYRPTELRRAAVEVESSTEARHPTEAQPLNPVQPSTEARPPTEAQPLNPVQPSTFTQTKHSMQASRPSQTYDTPQNQWQLQAYPQPLPQTGGTSTPTVSPNLYEPWPTPQLPVQSSSSMSAPPRPPAARASASVSSSLSAAQTSTSTPTRPLAMRVLTPVQTPPLPAVQRRRPSGPQPSQNVYEGT